MDPPSSLVARDWMTFLLACDDARLDAIETDGLDASWPDDTPKGLLSLVERARTVCAMPAIGASPPGPERTALRRRETPRKRAQVDAFAGVLLPLAAGASRVVDVGSGHGHLTREIAERVERPVIGLERDAALTARARLLSTSHANAPVFAQTDVLLDGLQLTEKDCVIGLHACGELGDKMVESVARTGASLALVGCCLQKQSALSRVPLCDAHVHGDKLTLPRHLLGLSNLTARDLGVEATRAENLAGRERRLALHRLLSREVPSLRHGAELDGLNRRAAHRDMTSLVTHAFAVRGLSAPSPACVEEAAAWAHVYHARIRRLAIPRALLARALEVFVLADRARHLSERGYVVTIGCLFPPDVSARNLVLLARRDRDGVPLTRGTLGKA